MRGGGRGGDVEPLGQSVGVPDTELLSCRDFPQHAVEDLHTGGRKAGQRGGTLMVNNVSNLIKQIPSLALKSVI